MAGHVVNESTCLSYVSGHTLLDINNSWRNWYWRLLQVNRRWKSARQPHDSTWTCQAAPLLKFSAACSSIMLLLVCSSWSVTKDLDFSRSHGARSVDSSRSAGPLGGFTTSHTRCWYSSSAAKKERVAQGGKQLISSWEKLIANQTRGKMIPNSTQTA